LKQVATLLRGPLGHPSGPFICAIASEIGVTAFSDSDASGRWSDFILRFVEVFGLGLNALDQMVADGTFSAILLLDQPVEIVDKRCRFKHD
jgi:hypothetical protein